MGSHSFDGNGLTHAKDSLEGDALADGLLTRILGLNHPSIPPSAGLVAQKMRALVKLLSANQVNGNLGAWSCDQHSFDPDAIHDLIVFVRNVSELPCWADSVKIERASDFFTRHGALSTIALFCVSLPTCYAHPSITAALELSGQLSAHTAYRIKTTAAMIFPVMLPGGLHGKNGGGVLAIIRARLVHAAIRSLILNGGGENALLDCSEQFHASSNSLNRKNSCPFESLYLAQWDTKKNGVPCNQEELVFVLLCFSKVFLDSMRKMGVKISDEDVDSFMHMWSVIGHLIGIQDLRTMRTKLAADTHFYRLQQSNISEPSLEGAKLTDSLINVMSESIPCKGLRGLPRLMSKNLCDEKTRDTLMMNRSTSLSSKIAYSIFNICGNIHPNISQLILHKVGNRFAEKILGLNINEVHLRIKKSRISVSAR